MAKLVIVRGLPGSGKTTFAKSLVSSGAADVFYEADQWLMDGEDYVWSVDRVKAAHTSCQEAVFSALKEGKNVVVSNTFVKRWEIKVYTDISERVGAEYFIVHTKGNFGSVHNVPTETIERMAKNWEEFS